MSRARELLDQGHASVGRPERALLKVYTQIDEREVKPGAGSSNDRSALLMSARRRDLEEAGADSVIFQATHERPDPRPLIDAMAIIAD